MFEKRLGISIYPEIVGIEETKQYIEMAKKYGFKRIFANLLEINDDEVGREKLAKLKSVYSFATKLGFEMIVDVNPNFYKAFKLQPNEVEFFHDLDVTGIRLDEDFKGIVEAELSNNKYDMKVELNASSGWSTFQLALDHKAKASNLIACHNFYPMRYTGLDKTRFIELSSIYKSKGIRVAAFVTLPESQKGIGPWNVNEGMPTIEEHRDLSLDEQVIDYLKMNVVDDIILSQQGATEEQFKALSVIINTYNKYSSLNHQELRVKVLPSAGKVEKDILLINKNKNHANRPDFNSYFVRSTYPRIDYKDEVIKPSNSGKKLVPGDVIIVNENLGRYKGELHIITKELDDTKQCARNLIGHLNKEDEIKLLFLKDGNTFKIIEE